MEMNICGLICCRAGERQNSNLESLGSLADLRRIRKLTDLRWRRPNVSETVSFGTKTVAHEIRTP